jgi:hypothetical protein
MDKKHSTKNKKEVDEIIMEIEEELIKGKIKERKKDADDK